MYYDWEKIFKEKSDSELYQIYIGNSMLNEQARQFAELELRKRGFVDGNKDEFLKKMELERMFLEEGKVYLRFRSTSFLMIGIVGIIFLLSVLFKILLGILEKNFIASSLLDSIFTIVVGVCLIIFGFIGYASMKKQEVKREREIREKIKNLQ